MRQIFITLFQNIGTGVLGNQLGLSSYPVIKVGSISWQIDQGDQLTRCTAGDLTVEILDFDDSAWAFIQGSLTTSGALLPPYLQMLVDGQQVFLGIINPSKIIQHLASNQHSIEIGASDWSTQLSSNYLNTWFRPVPKVVSGRSASAPLSGYSAQERTLYNGLLQNQVLFAGPPNWINKGDRITNTLMPGITFTALNVIYPATDVFYPTGLYMPPGGPYTEVTFDKSPWPSSMYQLHDTSVTHQGGNGAWHTTWTYDPNSAKYLTDTFTRQASATTEQNYYTVMVAVPSNPAQPVNNITFDTVDGIVTGDVLHLILGTNTSQSYTVMSVNPELLQITTKEAVSNLAISNRMYFDNDTNGEIVFDNAKNLITKAAYPFSVDLSRFVQAQTNEPVFGWVPLHSNGTGQDLTAVSDLQPTLTGCSVLSGLASQYTGTPDSGWTWQTATPVLQADWTSQLLAAPSSLMPYEVKTLAPYARLRNRCYHDYNWYSVDNGPNPATGIDSWTPSIANTIPVSIFYDYINMQKITLSSNGATITTNAWSGSSFAGNVGVSWPSGLSLHQIVNFPTGPTASSLLAYTALETIELAFYGAGGVKSTPVPVALKGGQLVTTPYGPYLIGPTGYGQITYSAGVLSCSWASFSSSDVSCLWPNTFVASSSSEAFVMGRLDDLSNGLTETWAFRLNMVPNSSNPEISIVLSEKIQDGVPIFAGAIKDPSKTGRVVGHLGGLLWQLDTIMPWTVERFTPSGMTSIECIEHICQLQNAMAISLASGKLAIVSRKNSESPINLTGIKIVKSDTALSWDNFYSIILVETQDGTYFAQANGQAGGTLLTISGHPMIWHLSQAQATADALAGWFGQPRATLNQDWFSTDATNPALWEGLSPFTLLTVNGSIQYRIVEYDNDYVSGKCSVTLIQN